MKRKIADIDLHLCVSCGLCKGVCPKNCIEMHMQESGQYLPSINEELCINCGLCFDICPAFETNIKHMYKNLGQNYPDNLLAGNAIECFNGKINDFQLRETCTGGGVVTGFVQFLLKEKIYDCAFLVSGYNCQVQVKAEKIAAEDCFDSVPQSRYVPVSQEKTIEYIKKNPQEKVIVVGVGCVISGIRKVIRKLNLNKDHYLLLGLFCACSLNYNSFYYFETYFGHKLKEFYWRDKSERKYWYGSIKPVFKNNKYKLCAPVVRAYLKNTMKLERCIYCFDLLNTFADCSFGDNNTKTRDGDSTSVIVRTKKGKAMMDLYKREMTAETISLSDLYNSQHTAERETNLLRSVVYEKLYHEAIYVGAVIDKDFDYEATEKDMRKQVMTIRKYYRKRNIRKLALVNKIKYVRFHIMGCEKSLRITKND